MLLIDALPVPTPADAERLLADLWQLTAARRLGLYVLGLGGRLLLGVHSPHGGIEEAAAATIADHCGGALESGSLVVEIVKTAAQTVAMNLAPTDRRLEVESRTFGWQRTDPLRGTFLALANVPEGVVAGVAVSLRAVPDLGFAMSLGVFAAGESVGSQAMLVASSLGGIGVRLRRPILQRRAVRQMLSGALHRPAAVRRVEVVTLFWHPPYGAEDDLAVRAANPRISNRQPVP